MDKSDLFTLTLTAIDARIGALSIVGCDGSLEMLKYIEACVEKDEEKCIEYWMVYENVNDVIHMIHEERYQGNTEEGNDFYCLNCSKISCLYDHKSADVICYDCGISRTAGPNVSRTVQWETKDQYQIIKKVFYDRVVNMKTILRNMQAYPSPLPQKVTSFIMRHRGNRSLTIKGLRKLMKNEKLSFSLKMAPTILEMINPDYKTLKLNGSEMQSIINMFKRVIIVFDELKDCGKIVRKNFLHYNFVLCKICKRLGIEKVINHLVMPKIRSTILKHEELWLLIENLI